MEEKEKEGNSFFSCPQCQTRLRNNVECCPQCGSRISAAPRSGEKPEIIIGRAPECDLVLTWPQVSRRHVRLFRREGVIYIEDLGSKNGTYLGDYTNRLAPCSPAPLRPSDNVFLGPHKLNLSLLANFGFDEFGGRGRVTGESPKTIALKTVLTIGRAPDNDIVLHYPQISAYHARLFSTAEGFIIEDLGSTNGTFINGAHIKQSRVHERDVIGIGPYNFRIGPDGLLQQEDYRGDIRLDARSLRVQVRDRSSGQLKTLIDNISLSIYPKEFVGLMGPAGAGKTTLLMALNGFSRPQHGNVYINGYNLYKHYDCFRGNIGYVTQDDILYHQLTVRKALYYTARLRLPQDISDAEIMKNIEAVLAELRMADKIDTPIGSPEKKVLSGGQRKRVNLAQELITQPSILFLDEPTSGLSSLDAEEVMDTLERLAQNGRTIILTIHQPSLRNYLKMSQVILLTPGGKLAYFGKTDPDSFEFFETSERHPDQIMRNLMTRAPDYWQNKYCNSEPFRHYVLGRQQDSRVSISTASQAPEPLRVNPLHQLKVLTQRYFEVKIKDTVNTLILLLQAPVIAGLVSWVFKDAQDVLKPLFLLSIVAIWFGCSNAAREIVSEQAIYRRERMVNLLIPTYLLSKLLVLAALCALQCAILVGVAAVFIEFHGSLILTFLLLLLTSLGGVATGLLLSALVRTQEAAISLVPLTLIPQIIFGGLLVKILDRLDLKLLSHPVISKWCYEGLLALESKGADAAFQTLVQQSIGFPLDRIGLDFLIIALYLVAVMGLTGMLLKRKER